MSTVKPYQSISDSKKQQVSRMFDNIAGTYDFLNHFLTLGIDKGWRRKLISLLAEVKPAKVLDVATGTADVAIASADLPGIQEIIGIDISPGMLEIGKKKITKQRLDPLIRLQVGDSEQLPFEEGYFDAVTVSFGVRNFENLEKGLREMQRVIRPGGRVLILEFSHPTTPPFKQFYWFYARYILPLIGKLTSKDPEAYKYLYRSVVAFPANKEFLAILNKSGFQNTTATPLSLGICTIYSGYK